MDLIIIIIIISAIAFLGVKSNLITKATDYYNNKREYSDIIENKSDEYNVPQSVIYAVIQQESRFDASAESRVGARGLMQIMEITSDWIDKKRNLDSKSWNDMFDPEKNIDYGVWLLKYLFDLYGDWDTVYAAYNAGFNKVNSWLKDSNYSSDGVHLDFIPYEETDNYVKKVKAYQDWYEITYDLK